MSTEIETKAKEMGWSPKEEFRGDPEKWVDAETFVKRGEEVMPILKAQNKRLQDRIARVEAQNAATNKLLEENRDALRALTETTSKQALDAVRQKKVELTSAIKKARENEDVDGELQLQSELRKAEEAIEQAQKPKTTAPTGGQSMEESSGTTKEHPEFKGWLADNEWFGSDKRRTALALAVANELREGGEKAEGRKFFDKVTEEVEKMFNPPKTTRESASKVEGGGGTKGGGGSTVKGQSYADLPPEAKQACENQIDRLVGPNKAFKTADDWRKHYTTKFFEE